MWAAGIITYQLLYGVHPLDAYAQSRLQMEQKLK
jgi:hypothetical protein